MHGFQRSWRARGTVPLLAVALVGAACSGDDATLVPEIPVGAPGPSAAPEDDVVEPEDDVVDPDPDPDPDPALSSPPEVTVQRISVSLPSYPFWPGTVVEEDPMLLDGFAAEYMAEVGPRAPELPRFLYGWVPVRAFDRIFAADDPVAEAPGLLWLFHLSGYFGGVWLRGELDRAQPGAHNVATVFVEPAEAGFRATAAEAEAGLDAAAGDDAAVVSHSERSLFPTGEGGVTDGIVDNFGYNQGYMLQILEDPPAGLETPAQYSVTCAGPLSCEYASPKLDALVALREVESALAGEATPAYAELAARIQPVQDDAVPRGRGVWSGILSVQGFPQSEYDQLLDVSSSYLEDVQATALAAAKTVGEGDVETGRRAAVANAAMTVWLAGYTAGLVEGRDPADVPVFVIE